MNKVAVVIVSSMLIHGQLGLAITEIMLCDCKSQRNAQFYPHGVLKRVLPHIKTEELEG